ncbi:MAG: HAMP domain-containing sensor histidine kinase [Lentisphaeria bacterium]
MSEENKIRSSQPLLFWRRILVLLVLLTVLMTGCAVFAGLWLANQTLAKRAVQENCHNLATIMLELHLPSSSNLLQKLRRISGSEVVITGEKGDLLASTLPADIEQELQTKCLGNRDYWKTKSGQRFFVSSAELLGRAQILWLLLPGRPFRNFLPETSGRIIGLAFAAGGSAFLLGLLIASSYRRLWCRLELVNRRLELAERLALAGRMSASVVHELRNPLSGIKMNAQVLQEESRTGGQENNSLQFIIREIERMEAYLRGLTDLAGENAGSEPAETALYPFLTDLRTALAARFQHAGVCLQIHCSEKLADQWIACSQSAFWQVLMNLLSNALEVSPSGSKVILATERQEKLLVLKVEDQGGGVQCKADEDIFAPFVTTKAHGCGLGLHICRTTLERFAGTITWENTFNGALFIVTLPLLEKPPAQAL